eukprot:Hpha_TRINITY_DN16607_c1_g1::TRINITY_DN16607_c1_g1_i2::g.182892::m.182892
MKMVFGVVALGLLATPASAALADYVSAAQDAIHAKYGPKYGIVEVDVGQKNTPPLHSLSDAKQIHVTATYVNQTFPGVEAFCNKTGASGVNCSYIEHSDPLLEDRVWPLLTDAIKISYDDGLAALRKKVDCTSVEWLNTGNLVL